MTAKGAGRVLVTLALTVAASASPGYPATQSASFKQHEVIAVFLFNFAHFITWPDQSFPSSDSPLRYCMMGQNPVFGPLEKAIKGETVGNHELELMTVAEGDDLGACHIVFVGEPEKASFGVIVDSTRGRNVLTVSDVEEFTEVGGMISLISKDKRLRPLINKPAVDATDLSVSSKLMRVAILSDGQGNGNHE